MQSPSVELCCHLFFFLLCISVILVLCTFKFQLIQVFRLYFLRAFGDKQKLFTEERNKLLQ